MPGAALQGNAQRGKRADDVSGGCCLQVGLPVSRAAQQCAAMRLGGRQVLNPPVPKLAPRPCFLCRQVGLPVSRAAQQCAATCLGLLGAVDPARLALKPKPPGGLAAADGALLVDLVEVHLVRVLRVASHLFQLDAATYAIQVTTLPPFQASSRAAPEACAARRVAPVAAGRRHLRHPGEKTLVNRNQVDTLHSEYILELVERHLARVSRRTSSRWTPPPTPSR